MIKLTEKDEQGNWAMKGVKWEDLEELVERNAPKKPDYEGDSYADDGQLLYDTWICPCCETRYEVDYHDYAFCPHCGQRMYNTWICPNCEARYVMDNGHYEYCPHCGQRIDWEEK